MKITSSNLNTQDVQSRTIKGHEQVTKVTKEIIHEHSALVKSTTNNELRVTYEINKNNTRKIKSVEKTDNISKSKK